ncbi:MAG: hypothetical protein PHI29_12980 [Gallionella sp.]|nr:hypothetical protein [Gallionella sp.]
MSKFSIGLVTTTPNALVMLAACYTLPEDLLDRHINGDWGDLEAENRQRNDEALHDGSRILSAYVMDEGWKVCVITEAADDDGVRSHTTILLPEEY